MDLLFLFQCDPIRESLCLNFSFEQLVTLRRALGKKGMTIFSDHPVLIDDTDSQITVLHGINVLTISIYQSIRKFGSRQTMYYLLEHANLPAIGYLLDCKFGIEQEFGHRSFIDVALQTRNLEVIRFLFDRNRNWFPHLLKDAIGYEHYELVKFAISMNYPINGTCFNDLTYLMLAITTWNYKIIKLLIEFGADLELTDSMGETALHYAVQQNQLDVVKIVVEAGANLNHLNANGISPLRSSVFGNKNCEIIKYLAQSGANVNDCNGGHTVLMTAMVDIPC